MSEHMLRDNDVSLQSFDRKQQITGTTSIGHRTTNAGRRGHANTHTPMLRRHCAEAHAK